MRAKDEVADTWPDKAQASLRRGCGGGRPPLQTVLPALCVTEIVSWGVLYYAFPVLAPQISQETGWSSPVVAAAFSGALIVSALAGIPLGRVLDRRGPRRIMTGGSLLAAPAVAAVALAPNLQLFIIAWLVCGLAMSATLYPPAFAAVTGWFDGPQRTRALTTVTLVAGLASTVFAPLTATLAHHMSWRTTYLILAAVLAAVTVPLHALCLRAPWPARSGEAAADLDAAAARRPESAVARTRPFLILGLSMALASFAFAAAVVATVPLLTNRALSSEAAAWALGLGGVGQVLGRLGYAALIRRVGVRARIVLAYSLGGLTTLALGIAPGPVALLIAASMAAGAVRGVATLLQATAITDRWGAQSYGALSGLLSAPAVAATALAPWAGAALATLLGGYPALFALLAALLGSAAVLAAGSVPGKTTRLPDQ
ncbi:MFS transporter [Streptomyces sp. CB00072]|uniref:MFS transporter n=1 Tax=Streptomyces sp. CB00072 TaxID=1703928 RepID=UPI000A457132